MMIGRTFGRLTVIEVFERRRTTGDHRYLCRCTCGNPTVGSRSSLVRGQKKSCGCLAEEQRQRWIESRAAKAAAKAARAARPPAPSKHPLYVIWRGVQHRCRHDPRYLLLGRDMHPAWAASFWEFAEYVQANLGPRPERHSLDRVDNDIGYVPGNIRWATPKVQAGNRRRSEAVTAYNLPLVAEYMRQRGLKDLHSTDDPLLGALADFLKVELPLHVSDPPLFRGRRLFLALWYAHGGERVFDKQKRGAYRVLVLKDA